LRRWAQIFTDGRKPLECGTGQRLILTNVTYEQQGQYICLASNKINGNVREVKSDPVSLQVVGAPRVSGAKRATKEMSAANHGIGESTNHAALRRGKNIVSLLRARDLGHWASPSPSLPRGNGTPPRAELSFEWTSRGDRRDRAIR
jgi:hypothetical protein